MVLGQRVHRLRHQDEPLQALLPSAAEERDHQQHEPQVRLQRQEFGCVLVAGFLQAAHRRDGRQHPRLRAPGEGQHELEPGQGLFEQDPVAYDEMQVRGDTGVDAVEHGGDLPHVTGGGRQVLEVAARLIAPVEGDGQVLQVHHPVHVVDRGLPERRGEVADRRVEIVRGVGERVALAEGRGVRPVGLRAEPRGVRGHLHHLVEQRDRPVDAFEVGRGSVVPHDGGVGELVQQVAAHRVVGRAEVDGPLQMEQSLLVVVRRRVEVVAAVQQAPQDGMARQAQLVVLGQPGERLPQQDRGLLVLRRRHVAGPRLPDPLRQRRAQQRRHPGQVRTPGVEQAVQLAQTREVRRAFLGPHAALTFAVDVDQVPADEDPGRMPVRNGRGQQLQLPLSLFGIGRIVGRLQEGDQAYPGLDLQLVRLVDPGARTGLGGLPARRAQLVEHRPQQGHRRAQVVGGTIAVVAVGERTAVGDEQAGVGGLVEQGHAFVEGEDGLVQVVVAGVGAAHRVRALPSPSPSSSASSPSNRSCSSRPWRTQAVAYAGVSCGRVARARASSPAAVLRTPSRSLTP